MDRMLIAQALRSGRPIITSDTLFEGYGVVTLW
jgi:PIN domain nuclease of toxin-antitoxin system